MRKLARSKDFDHDIRKIRLATHLVEVLACLSCSEVLPIKQKNKCT